MTDSTTSRDSRLQRARDAAVNAAGKLSSAVMPAVPESAKRLMTRPLTIDGNTLDPTLQLALASLKMTGEADLTARDDVAYSRERVRLTADALGRKPVPVGAVTELSIPGPAGTIGARHYQPDNSQVGPLLVYFHGGGFVVADLDVFDHVCRTLCRGAGIHVLSIDYRLAPEHPAPAGLDDAYAAFRWALEHGTELGTRPGAVAVGGDSAGGNLATVVARLGRDDGAPPAFQLLLYPITDLAGTFRSHELFADGFFLTAHDMEFCRGHYLSGGIDVTDPRVSPLRADDLAALPPALVITAGFDVLRDEGEAYAERMRAAGVTVDSRRMSSLIHAFCNFATLGGASARAMDEISSALRAHLCYV